MGAGNDFHRTPGNSELFCQQIDQFTVSGTFNGRRGHPDSQRPFKLAHDP